MSKMIAILHDATFDGDSLFYVTSSESTNVVPFVHGDTLGMLIEKARQFMRKEGDDEESIEETAKEVKGAWILDEKGIDVIEAATDVECGSDSAVYRVNSVAKRVAQKVAANCLGEKAGDEE